MIIWVGIDGSKQSEPALYWAMRHAKQQSETRPSEQPVTVQPVMCWHYPAPLGTAIRTPSASIVAAETKRQADRVMRAVGLMESPGVKVAKPMIIEGEAADSLIELGVETDLIVVGSRGLGGFRGLVLGSVSSRVAGLAKCPVAIVPSDWSATAEPKGRIIVGFDRSGPSRAAGLWAVHHQGDAVVRIIHAWHVPALAGLETLRASDAHYKAEAKALIQSFAKSLVAEAVHAEAVEAIAIEGDPRRALRDEAAQADLLVIGAQRFHGLSRVFFGSVAQSIVNHLAIPTVIVPGPEEVGW